MTEVKNKLDTIIIASKFKENGQLKPEQITIRVQDKIVCSLGNFVTIAGLPKARKSTFMLGFVASAISGESIWDIEVTLPENKKDILLIDTEQSPYDFAKGIERLKYIAGIDALPDNFSGYCFRQYDPDVILASVERLLSLNDKIGLLVLDSLTDLCMNVNDPVESKLLTQTLKRWSAKYNISIITLLHLSKASGFTLGALGSYSDRACQSTMLVEKDAEAGVSFLKAKYLRSDEDFQPIPIYWNYNNNRYEIFTGAINTAKKFWSVDNYDWQHHKNAVDILFNQEKLLQPGDVLDKLKYLYGTGNKNVKEKVIPYLVSCELMLHTKKGFTQNQNINQKPKTP